MPRREILSPAQREELLIIPVDRAGLIEHYVLSEQDLSLICVDPFAAIEQILPWEDFAQSVSEAERLPRPEDFDFLGLITDGYSQLRRFAPTLIGDFRLPSGSRCDTVDGRDRNGARHESRQSSHGTREREH